MVNLTQQAEIFPDVELLYLGDNKKRTVGHKRNDLLRLAQGKYIVFVDDDDMVSKDYIRKIHERIDEGADAIVFNAACSINGNDFKDVLFDLSYKRDFNFVSHYRRMINHIMVVKRELALQVMFPEKSFGEDYSYARTLKKLIKTQSKINEILYWYIFDQQTTETQ